MKQYTSKDQTAKLIELGFPKPQSIVDVDVDYSIRDHTIYNAYSIGELIEFLEHRMYRIENDMQWFVDVAPFSLDSQELIDSLFKACVTLKEEGLV